MRLFPQLLAPLCLALFSMQPNPGMALSFDEISLDLLNPATSLGHVTNDLEYRSFQGDLPGASDQSQWDLVITPSIPFPLKNGKNLVLSARIPVSFGEPTYFADGTEYTQWRIRQFADTIPTDGEFFNGHGHLADIGLKLAYGGANDNNFIATYGLELVLTNSQDGSVERDQILLGPEFALGKITDWGIIGARVSHLTNITDADDRDYEFDTNISALKVFFAYGLGNGWQVISNPAVEYDWEGTSGNKLALPIGVGVAKTARLGNMPFKAAIEIQNYLKSPDAFGPDWLLKFSFTPVFWDRSR